MNISVSTISHEVKCNTDIKIIALNKHMSLHNKAIFFDKVSEKRYL